MTQPVVLDTDVLSALMRKHTVVTARAQTYLSAHSNFTISLITRYEILRGLKTKEAHKQASTFDLFCARNRILPVTDEVVVRASQIYADLHTRGVLIGDADILIAASALTFDFGVATNNEDHFWRIANLHVENWVKVIS